jgi:hypothetical protein
MEFTFQGLSSVRKMMNVQGNQAPAKQQKTLRKLENSSIKIVAEQPMNSQTPPGSAVEFPRITSQKI